MIGCFLADHRVLFEDDRRQQILIECFDVFIEALPRRSSIIIRIARACSLKLEWGANDAP